MRTFVDVLLLTLRGDIYGNENVLLYKVGQLLLVYEKGEIRCYVINSSQLPVLPYTVQRLKDECIAGTKKCDDAFGEDNKLTIYNTPDVTFRIGTDGTCTITFELEPIELKNGVQFYNLLVKQFQGKDEGLNVFQHMVEIRKSNDHSRVKVFLHNGKSHVPTSSYDVVVNVSTAGSILNSIPYFWDVYYDGSSSGEGIEYSPVLLRLSRYNLRPLQQTKN